MTDAPGGPRPWMSGVCTAIQSTPMPDAAAQPAVDILLSTYNGEQHLAEQLESLYRQTHANWTLHVRDDGSKDGTVALLEEHARRDGRIRIHRDDLGNLRPTRAFLRLAGLSTAPYFAFCDQDDVWLPQKIEKTLAKLRTLGDGPALVFTDLEVVDQEMRHLHPSFIQHCGLDPVAGIRFNRQLMQVISLGCTMMGNQPMRALVQMSDPLSTALPGHDWWVSLLASAMGQLAYLPEATIKYRQHGSNASGGAWSLSWLRFFRSLVKPNATPWHFMQRYARRAGVQARILLQTHRSSLTVEQIRLAEMTAKLGGGYPPWAAWRCLNSGIRCKSIRQNAALVLFAWPRVRDQN